MKIEYEVVMQTARCATFDAVQFVNRKIECIFFLSRVTSNIRVNNCYRMGGVIISQTWNVYIIR